MDLKNTVNAASLLYDGMIRGKSDIAKIPFYPQKTYLPKIEHKTPFPKAAPEHVGLKTRDVLRFCRTLSSARAANIHSMLLLCNGKQIFEAASPGYDIYTPHAVYSFSKTVTGLAIGMLIEDNRLSLGDYVYTFFPEYKPQKLSKRMRLLTVRHLLTMSGGLSYDMQTKPIQEVVRENGGKPTTEACVNAFIKTPLSFEPGARFQYSLCHDVLAAVVQKASGKRFSEYMDEVIFQPLGMTESGFHTEKKGMYDMYDCDENGNVWQITPHNRLILGENYDSGGAGVISTVDDYVKFAITLANGGKTEQGYRLLCEDTLQNVRSTAHTEMCVENAFTCIQGDEYCYGLGVRVRMKDTPWGLTKGEYGWDGAAGTYLMVDPHRKIAVVMGMHLLSWPYVFRGEHLKIVQCLYEDMQEEGLL